MSVEKALVGPGPYALPERMVGLDRVRVLEMARADDGRLHVAAETTDLQVGYPECGVRADPTDRDQVERVDLPAFESQVRLVWVKRRSPCPEPLCAQRSWTEEPPDT